MNDINVKTVAEKKFQSSGDRTLAQNKRLNGLLFALGIDKDEKELLVAAFTDGRTDRSSLMKEFECGILIEHLQERLNRMKGGSSYRPNFSSGNKMRRKIISYCHQMRMQNPDQSIDMVKVDAFILDKGYLKKPLNDYTEAELPKLIYQIGQLKNHFIKKVTK